MSRPQADDLPLAEALARVLAATAPVAGRQRLALTEAHGHVLAAPACAGCDSPPFAASAMDGYALAAASGAAGTELPVVGQALAGHPHAAPVPVGACVRITTGGPVPAGCDAVIPQEDVERRTTAVRLGRTVRAGENVRARGEECTAGEVLFAAGHRLDAMALATLAGVGVAEVETVRPLRVTIASSGDELTAAGAPLAPGHIYERNRPLLRALLAPYGVQLRDLGVLSDRPAALEALVAAGAEADLLITTGGVSVGDADLLVPLLAREGQIGFWRARIKPGRPVLFGRLAGAHYFGLPGNPVSALVTFLLLVRPALLRLSGAAYRPPPRWPARLEAPLRKRPGRLELQRGRLRFDAGGALPTVRPLGGQGSHLLREAAEADCLIQLEESRGELDAGEIVPVLSLRQLLAP